jgi:hypothetical protein
MEVKMPKPTDDDALADHLKVLKGIKLDGVDYETLGKVVVAGILREQKKIFTH